ncbi:hypothetical protein PTKIN_Ptkin15bG0118400 [Pterospermum kingtungense]
MSKPSPSLVSKTNHPRQIQVNTKRHIMEAFGPDKTTEEMLAAFQDMKASFDVADLGLERFDDSLECLNRAESLLCRLEKEGVASVEEIRPGMHAVQLELANVKTAMGRRDEALENLKKALNIMEMNLEKDSEELGMAYRDLADDYFLVSNLKEALPFGLKALEIHEEELGHHSAEVAHDRRILGAIYAGLGEHNKALKQFVLLRKVFKHCGLTFELPSAKMDVASMQISLGRFYEAFITLKYIAQQTNNEKDSENQASMFIFIGQALCNQGKFADLKVLGDCL